MLKKTSLVCACLYCVALGGQQSSADAFKAAQRLLQVADVQRHFETRTAQQVRAIIRSYASIVAMSVSIELPPELTRQISNCYMEVYAWENFEEGLARILAENLTEKELQLLTDFYDNLGLPPTQIQSFKETIAKAERIQEVSLEYMLSNSASCVEQDAALILDYVAQQAVHPVAIFATD